MDGSLVFGHPICSSSGAISWTSSLSVSTNVWPSVAALLSDHDRRAGFAVATADDDLADTADDARFGAVVLDARRSGFAAADQLGAVGRSVCVVDMVLAGLRPYQ